MLIWVLFMAISVLNTVHEKLVFVQISLTMVNSTDSYELCVYSWAYVFTLFLPSIKLSGVIINKTMIFWTKYIVSGSWKLYQVTKVKLPYQGLYFQTCR